MLSTLPTVLVDPESFLEQQAADPDFAGPIVIITVLALATLATSVPVVQSMSRIELVQQIRGPFILGMFVGVFVRWVLIALLFYGLSAIFDGTGRFLKLFILLGWGFIPSILDVLVEGGITFLLFSNVGFSTIQGAQQYVQSAQTTPLGLVDLIFGLLMTLWTAWIWAHAVAIARDLSFRQAAICVGIVVGASTLIWFLSFG